MGPRVRSAAPDSASTDPTREHTGGLTLPRTHIALTNRAFISKARRAADPGLYPVASGLIASSEEATALTAAHSSQLAILVLRASREHPPLRLTQRVHAGARTLLVSPSCCVGILMPVGLMGAHDWMGLDD